MNKIFFTTLFIFSTTIFADTWVDTKCNDGFFVRGDVDGNGQFNLSDATNLLDCIFNGNCGLICEFASLDVNDDGFYAVADSTYLLSWMFNGTSPPPEPFGETTTISDAGYDCTFNTTQPQVACWLTPGVSDTEIELTESCDNLIGPPLYNSGNIEACDDDHWDLEGVGCVLLEEGNAGVWFLNLFVNACHSPSACAVQSVIWQNHSNPGQSQIIDNHGMTRRAYEKGIIGLELSFNAYVRFGPTVQSPIGACAGLIEENKSKLQLTKCEITFTNGEDEAIIFKNTPNSNTPISYQWIPDGFGDHIFIGDDVTQDNYIYSVNKNTTIGSLSVFDECEEIFVKEIKLYSEASIDMMSGDNYINGEGTGRDINEALFSKFEAYKLNYVYLECE